jgi:hypothetical protein
VATHAESAQVQLRDLLSPESPDVMLTDISMSSRNQNAGTMLMFTRIVSCQDIQMSSGCTFPFPPRWRRRLLDAYATRMKSVACNDHSERRFIFFFQRHREFGGIPIYAELPE